MNTQSTVKWFNDAKGYGFIDSDASELIWLHYSKLQVEGFKTIAEGDRVIFDVTQGAKGLIACNVRKLDV